MSGIKYISINEANGYGIAARRYIQSLISAGKDLTWTPMVKGMDWGLGYQPYDNRQSDDAELATFCNRAIDYDTVIIHTIPEYYPHWLKRETGKKIIGYTVWETDTIPAHWREILNSVDQLIVPCQWNREVFMRCGVARPIAVIPHLPAPVDNSAPVPLPNSINNDDYVFYTINEWNTRKSIWLTVRAFCQAFSARDRVQLIIKTSRRDLTRKYFKFFYRDTARALNEIMKKYPNAPRISLINTVLSDAQMRALHARGDCYISLCRGEGWGMGAFDAAGLGKPIIITGYGGQCEYLPADRAFLVDYRLVPVIYELRKDCYDRNQHWAEPDLTHAEQLMRTVYQQRDIASARGRALQAYLQENFNAETIIKKFLALLTEPSR